MAPLLLGLGCAHSRHSFSNVDPAPVVFGWRLAIGEEFTYAFTTRLTNGEDETVRQEHWTYLVRDVDDFGVFTLQGVLTAFGVNSRINGVETEPANINSAAESELERLSALEVTIGLSMDGRISWIEGLPWADNFPHTLIGLPMPLVTVEPGAIWSDPTGLRPITGIFPGDLALEVIEEHQFESLVRIDDELVANVVTEGVVQSQELLVPVIRVQGSSDWSLTRGLLMSRSWVVVLDDPERRLSEASRKLEITISRVE